MHSGQGVIDNQMKGCPLAAKENNLTDTLEIRPGATDQPREPGFHHRVHVRTPNSNH